MIKVLFDYHSPYTVRWPKRHQRSKIIELAQTFVAYEQSMLPEEQTPYTEAITNLLADVTAGRSTVSQGEAQRLIAAEEVKQLDRKAKRLITHMAKVVGAAVHDAPANAISWGFQVRQSSGTFRKPASRAKCLVLLEAYVAKEESRPEAERFTSPDLSKVKQVKELLAAHVAARNTAQTRREGGVAARNMGSVVLMEHLQAAAIYLVAGRFGFTLSSDLQYWGFDIVARRGAGLPDEEQNGEAVVSAEAAPQDSDAASNGVIYEAEQNGSYQSEPSVVNGST